jgi:hypothetical protein
MDEWYVQIVRALLMRLRYTTLHIFSPIHSHPHPTLVLLGTGYVGNVVMNVLLLIVQNLIYYHTEVVRVIFNIKWLFTIYCPTSFIFHLVPFFVFVHITVLTCRCSRSLVPRDTTPKIFLYFIRDNKQTSYYCIKLF